MVLHQEERTEKLIFRLYGRLYMLTRCTNLSGLYRFQPYMAKRRRNFDTFYFKMGASNLMHHISMIDILNHHQIDDGQRFDSNRDFHETPGLQQTVNFTVCHCGEPQKWGSRGLTFMSNPKPPKFRLHYFVEASFSQKMKNTLDIVRTS